MLLQMAIVYALSLLCEVRCENIHNLATDSSASGHSNVQLLGNSAVTSLLTLPLVHVSRGDTRRSRIAGSSVMHMFSPTVLYKFFLKKFHLFLFSERRERKRKRGEKH